MNCRCEVNGKTITLHPTFTPNLEDGMYSIEIVPLEKDKTRRQVNYFWALMREIAKKLDNNTENTERYYLQILKMAGIKIEGIWIKTEALDEFKKYIKHFVITDTNKEYSLVNVYKGISEMTVKEMQTLIDVAISYAERCGVNTDYWMEVFNQ